MNAPTNLADFLAGCPDSVASAIVLGDPKRFVYLNTGAAYAQDSFQVTKRFSLDYGLRWDLRRSPALPASRTFPSFRPPVPLASPSPVRE